MENTELTRKAIAYLRTSSATNVGPDKDSDQRQREAIHTYARQAGILIVGEYFDAAVSGADPIDSRPGFAALLKHIETNGARIIIVETASRFARDLMVGEVGFQKLQARGIQLIAADHPSSFIEQTPTAILVRQVLGAIAQFDKTMTVAKLRGARERKRKAGCKVEGRKSHAEKSANTVALAKRLYRLSPKTKRRRSLRQIADELSRAGHHGSSGKPFSPSVIKRMVER